MANMAHCRYRNTATDLEDCAGAMEQEGYEGLPFEEQMAAERLFENCQRYMEAFSERTGRSY